MRNNPTDGTKEHSQQTPPKLTLDQHGKRRPTKPTRQHSHRYSRTVRACACCPGEVVRLCQVGTLRRPATAQVRRDTHEGGKGTLNATHDAWVCAVSHPARRLVSVRRCAPEPHDRIRGEVKDSVHGEVAPPAPVRAGTVSAGEFRAACAEPHRVCVCQSSSLVPITPSHAVVVPHTPYLCCDPPHQATSLPSRHARVARSWCAVSTAGYDGPRATVVAAPCTHTCVGSPWRDTCCMAAGDAGAALPAPGGLGAHAIGCGRWPRHQRTAWSGRG